MPHALWPIGSHDSNTTRCGKSVVSTGVVSEPEENINIRIKTISHQHIHNTHTYRNKATYYLCGSWYCTTNVWIYLRKEESQSPYEIRQASPTVTLHRPPTHFPSSHCNWEKVVRLLNCLNVKAISENLFVQIPNPTQGGSSYSYKRWTPTCMNTLSYIHKNMHMWWTNEGIFTCTCSNTFFKISWRP